MSKLFCIHESVNYYLYRRPVKISKSFDSLAALIRNELNQDIINGDVFLFLNWSRTMIKVLVYERRALVYSTGVWIKGLFNCRLLQMIRSVIKYKIGAV